MTLAPVSFSGLRSFILWRLNGFNNFWLNHRRISSSFEFSFGVIQTKQSDHTSIHFFILLIILVLFNRSVQFCERFVHFDVFHTLWGLFLLFFENELLRREILHRLYTLFLNSKKLLQLMIFFMHTLSLYNLLNQNFMRLFHHIDRWLKNSQRFLDVSINILNWRGEIVIRMIQFAQRQLHTQVWNMISRLTINVQMPQEGRNFFLFCDVWLESYQRDLFQNVLKLLEIHKLLVLKPVLIIFQLDCWNEIWKNECLLAKFLEFWESYFVCVGCKMGAENLPQLGSIKFKKSRYVLLRFLLPSSSKLIEVVLWNSKVSFLPPFDLGVRLFTVSSSGLSPTSGLTSKRPPVLWSPSPFQ